MGFGAQGAYGAAGAQAVLRQILQDRLAAEAVQQKQRQQDFTNDLSLRTATRADEQLSAQTAQYKAVNQRADEAARNTEADRQATRAITAREMIQPGTYIPETDPSLTVDDAAGLGPTFTPTPATVPMGPDFAGPMPNDETPQQAQTGRIAGRLTVATPKQANLVRDDERAQAKDAQTAADREAAQTALEAFRTSTLANQRAATDARATAAQNKPSGPTRSMTVQATTGPFAGKTVTRLVDAQGNILTEDLAAQTGAQRTAEVNDATALQTFADIEKLGDQIGWTGTGPFSGSVKAPLKSYLDVGSDQGSMLRSLIAGVRTEIGHTMFGSAFTETEKAQLASYAPNESMASADIKNRLHTLARITKTRMQQREQGGPVDPLPSEITGLDASPAGAAAPATAPPSDGRKVGDIKTFPNGNRGRWDGTRWEQVQ